MVFGLAVYLLAGLAQSQYIYQGQEYSLREEKVFSRGRIVEYSNKEEMCSRYIIRVIGG